MTPGSLPQHIFLSHASSDTDVANTIVNLLVKAGIPVWIDRQDLIPGTPNWERALRDAISSSFAMLLIATPSTRDAHFVQAEIEIACKMGLPILVVWIEGTSWVECVPLRLVQSQYLDLRNQEIEKGLPILASQIRQLIRGRKPKHQKVTVARGSSWSIPGYIAVGIDPYGYGIPSGDAANVAVFDADSYGSVMELLDHLYLHYLKDRFGQSTYGASWVLVRDCGPINPPQVVAPYTWVLDAATDALVNAAPYWGGVPLNAYGISSGSVWRAADCAFKSEYLGTVHERKYVLAVNDPTLINEVLFGWGKQPITAVSAGFLEVTSVDRASLDSYKYRLALLEIWTGLQFARRAVCQTNRPFDPSSLVGSSPFRYGDSYELPVDPPNW